jgi:hypothetical protein
MITKKQMIEIINSLPGDEFNNVEPAIEQLIVLQKIQEGIAAAEKGDMISFEELQEEIKKW